MKIVTVNGRSVLPARNAQLLIDRYLIPTLRAELSPGTRIGPSHCKSDIVADGHKQVCALPIGDSSVRIRLTVLAVDPAHPAAQLHTDQALLDMRKIEAMGLAVAPSKGQVKSVSCSPQHFRAYEVDEMFTCNVTFANGKTGTLLVKADDDMGHASMRILP